MLERILRFSIRQRWVILALTLATIGVLVVARDQIFIGAAAE